VVVATGSGALVPDIEGLREAAPWTSRETVAAKAVPGRLAIIGGGAVASEMATAFSGLGSSVTMLARDGVLHLAEPFVGERVAESLQDKGVSVRIGAEAGSVKRASADGSTAVQKNPELSASHWGITGGWPGRSSWNQKSAAIPVRIRRAARFPRAAIRPSRRIGHTTMRKRRDTSRRPATSVVGTA
jgi:cation diffusion facilitator CzcD-associated flavoprotein CzcO